MRVARCVSEEGSFDGVFPNLSGFLVPRGHQWHAPCVLVCDPTALDVNINPASPAAPDPVVCDLSRKFVRVLRESADGLVAFEFAIGWPDLAVELAMPRPMFEEFCSRQQVERLADDAASPTLGGPRPQDDAISGDEA